MIFPHGGVSTSTDLEMEIRSPAAYNSISYQSGYGVDSVNPQNVCNP